MEIHIQTRGVVVSKFAAIWEDPEGSLFKFAVKGALKQDQIVHMVWRVAIQIQNPKNNNFNILASTSTIDSEQPVPETTGCEDIKPIGQIQIQVRIIICTHF